MNIVNFCFFLFLASWVIHLVLWRLRRPVRQTRALLVLFPACFFVVLGAAWFFPVWFQRLSGIYDKMEWVSVSLLYGCLVLAYIVTFSAVEQKSPTLFLVQMVAKSRSGGIPQHELLDHFLAQKWIGGKLASLVDDGFIVPKNEEYVLTRKGRLLAAAFGEYRRLAGFDQKGE